MDNKCITLSFVLGADVVVKSIIGLSPLRQWGGNIDFGKNMFVVPKL